MTKTEQIRERLKRAAIGAYLAEDCAYLLAENARLREAVEDFVAKVDRGDARSVDSYAKFKAALGEQ
ncbi:MAG: hypothetical protein KAJ55_00170 [Anaerolineales bacterium]|nr:hypothetical protein [Anaerolineales bacterium]